jgi:hypothetical protein
MAKHAPVALPGRPRRAERNEARKASRVKRSNPLAMRASTVGLRVPHTRWPGRSRSGSSNLKGRVLKLTSRPGSRTERCGGSATTTCRSLAVVAEP